MGAPNVTASISHSKISGVSGYDSLTVTFSVDATYMAFECRATKAGADWGLGKGALIASFPQTPADTKRTFEIYDDYLIQGDGDYRISLYVQGADGSWNDTYGFIPSETVETMLTSDGAEFLCRKGDA